MGSAQMLRRLETKPEDRWLLGTILLLVGKLRRSRRSETG